MQRYVAYATEPLRSLYHHFLGTARPVPGKDGVYTVQVHVDVNDLIEELLHQGILYCHGYGTKMTINKFRL